MRFSIHGKTDGLRGLLVVAALIPAACGQSASPTPPAAARSAPAAAAPSPTASPVPGADAAGIVWLCMPGNADNPCEGNLTVTAIDPSGKQTVETLATAADAPIDCFYVYPTISQQQTLNADLSIDKEERIIATTEVSPFSQVCKVYAPIYPQMTIAALNSGAITNDVMTTAYDGLLAGFDDYMANYNHGRGIVLMGHSQGAMDLISLLEDRFDSTPENRKLLVSALLWGGNATTAPGKTTGGDFATIPTCTSATQVGCVVGYSSFAEEPPSGAVFARLSSAYGFLRPPAAGEQIMCVNPTSPGGGKGIMKPLITPPDLAKFTADLPSPLPTTTFVSYTNGYSAECKSSGDATWLQVTRLDPKAAAPVVHTTEGDSWGLHDLDVSLPMGNTIELVRTETAAYKP
jgi:hypothetical protein